MLEKFMVFQISHKEQTPNDFEANTFFCFSPFKTGVLNNHDKTKPVLQQKAGECAHPEYLTT